MGAEIVWLISAAGIWYILILYPILLATCGGRRRPPVRKDLTFRPGVTVVMVVYNGQAFLRQKLDSLLALNYPPDRRQILVVSDGSTDDTNVIAAEYASRGVELLVCPHAGKAAGLNAAFAKAGNEILFFTDVRQPLDHDALAHLVANFADPTVGAVTGEMRLLGGKAGEQQDMGLYWRYELWARRKQTEIDSLFNTTGCIYAMRRSLIQTSLPPDTLSDDAVLPLRAFFAGYRVIFDPEAVAYDYPAIAGTEFRRRWRNLAGLWQVHVRTPALFGSANRMRWHFLSHKFGRLMLPWAIVAMTLATLATTSSPWRTGLLLSDVLLVVLALCDGWIPTAFPLKKLSSPARTFLVMNLASAAGITVFFLPAQTLWKPTKVGSAAKMEAGERKPEEQLK